MCQLKLTEGLIGQDLTVETGTRLQCHRMTKESKLFARFGKSEMRSFQFQRTKGEVVMRVKGQTRDWRKQLAWAFLRSYRREGSRNEITPGTRGDYIYRWRKQSSGLGRPTAKRWKRRKRWIANNQNKNI